MGSKNDLSNRINESYSKLSKGQKLLATYITDNYDKAVFLTAAKLGEVVILMGRPLSRAMASA